MHKAERKYEVGKVTDEEQAKQRQFKGILNKLTRQNFEKLFEQVKQVNIDNAGTLSGVIAQIFDMAILEPTSCEMYVNFCSRLSVELPDFSEDNKKITFKRLLLNRCQEEFERGEREQEEANRTEEEGDVKQSEEEREEKRVKARRRMLGNIRLIGELYKQKMLTERTMHECIKKLLGNYQNPDEEDIEALCKLMSTIGERIDHPKAKQHMDGYFDMMFKLSNNMKLSSRVRFMLKDFIDLRMNKWQQRRKVEGPTKIEEVHRDAAQECQAQSSRLGCGPNINSALRRGQGRSQHVDFGPRGSNVLPSPNSQMGYRGLPQQIRGYGNQDARFEERHKATPQNFEKLFEQVNTTWLVCQHLLSLSDTYPSLQPKTATFTHNDGRSGNLLQADGTVPIVFQNVTYNIPVVIWLMETYPRHPPLVFVNPTRDMIIKRQHPFVNTSGLVSIPYLQNWVYPSSNLVDLAINLSHYFGIDPPLDSQRRPIPNANPNHNPSFNPSGSSTVSISTGSTRPAIPPRTYPPSPYGSAAGPGRIPPPSPPSEDPGEVYKRTAINKLVENVHNDVHELRKKREIKMEGMFNAQAVLRQREDELSKGVREMHHEKEGLEQQLQMVLMNTDVLEQWVRENEGKLGGNAANVNGDEAFVPSDSLSKQMIESTASDLAIEDVIYALDKAVQDGSIPFDLYLRNVRLLSREQFFHRATSAKVRAAQMQAQVTSMAARAPPYGV